MKGSDPFLQRAERVIGHVLQLSATDRHVASSQAFPSTEQRAVSFVEGHGSPQTVRQADQAQTLEPLFNLIAQLHEHPELIPVTRDFIRELVPGE